MDKYQIGESMSDITDLGSIVEVDGEIYEDEVQALVHRPLDLGQVLYYKLSQAVGHIPDVVYEVWWDHKTNLLSATAILDKSKVGCSFGFISPNRAIALLEISRITLDMAKKLEARG